MMTRTESQINYCKDYLLRKDLLVSENTDAHISINAKIRYALTSILKTIRLAKYHTPLRPSCQPTQELIYE